MNSSTATVLEFPARACKGCGIVKPLEQFRKSGITSPKGKVYWEYKCRECRKLMEKRPEQRKKAAARRQRWREANPEIYFEAHTNSRLKTQYGITLEQAKAMLNNQGGVCANISCGKPLAFGTKDRKTTAVVDHCHASGVVRGVVCDGCNKALGHAYDNPQVLAGLVEYLRRERR